MKTLLFSAIALISGTFLLSSCAEKCTTCGGCNSLNDTTICENDYESESAYELEIQAYEADDCLCRED